MDRIRPYINRNMIKILVGQRRVGKSYILMAVVDEVRSSNPDANIITINLLHFRISLMRTA